MKRHMLPETASMFDQCVHSVVVREDAYGPKTIARELRGD